MEMIWERRVDLGWREDEVPQVLGFGIITTGGWDCGGLQIWKEF